MAWAARLSTVTHRLTGDPFGIALVIEPVEGDPDGIPVNIGAAAIGEL